jgi:CHAT domain-containing protein
VGLPSALLELGFAGVIATSWEAGDEACKFLTMRFYDLWLRHQLPPPVALAAAQHWLRTATVSNLTALLPQIPVTQPGTYPFADPFFWAVFAYTGS